jgi:O-antigen ligase
MRLPMLDINRKLQAISSYIFFLIVAFVPLPFGSYDKTTIAIWCAALGVTLITTALSADIFSRPHLSLFGCIGLTIICYAFVLHEQLADRPWIASPHPIWAQASAVLGEDLKPSVSITKGEPLFALGAPLACILALTCGLMLGRNRDHAHRLLQVVAWSGTAYAVYGILSFLIEPTMLLWREKRAYVGNLTGTFVNRNTAAAYFGSCSVVWLVLLFEQIHRHLRGTIIWKQVLSRLLTAPPLPIITSFLFFSISLIAMFLTGSRAGVVLSLFAMITGFMIYFRRYFNQPGGILIALGGAVLAALILLQFVGGMVSARFDVNGLADEGRFATYRSTINMIADHPWFGTGLGTFASAFPAYRGSHVSMYGVWDMAHSTPLELAAEVGLPLAVAVGFGWILSLIILVYGIHNRRRDNIVPLAALAVAAIALLHSSIDFSLQIPGYSIVVFAVLGNGLAQSFSCRITEQVKKPI